MSNNILESAVGLKQETTDDEEPVPFNSMAYASELVYSFANLRSIVRKHDEKYGVKDNGEVKVKFNSIELIVTVGVEKDTSRRKNAFLNRSISFQDILSFIQKNRRYLATEGLWIVFNDDWEKYSATEEVPKSRFEGILEGIVDKHDSDIWEFDDTMPKEDLVYGVVVNRTEKRVTIVFRGSVTLKDWMIDLSMSSTAPKDLQFARTKSLVSDDVRVHSGFASYLFDKDEVKGKSKYEEVLDDLDDVFSYKNSTLGRDYSDYSLFVTGHSLGGGLAQLLAITLAGRHEETTSYNTPVTAVTYASPRVGKSEYVEAFEKLEKSKTLRHIRVTNQNDVVPVSPPFYQQTGVNIHLHDGGHKADVSYGKSRFTLGQFRPSSGSAHSIVEHHDRLFTNDAKGDQINVHFLNKSVKQLYKEYANIEV